MPGADIAAFAYNNEEIAMLVSKRKKMLETSNKPIDIKYHNQKLLLSMFRQAETLSITEISQRAKLSKTTVAKVIGEFEAKGLVTAVGKGSSTGVGGKKPERFAFNPDSSHVIALMISQGKIHGALSDLGCNILRQREADCGSQMDYETALREMADMVLGLLHDGAMQPEHLCGLVIGCEGVIDAENRVIRYTLQHSWNNDAPIGRDLARLLPFPVSIRINNDVRLAGYAHLLNSPDQYETMVVISVNDAAGGCVVEAGDLVHGIHGFVGEFGHMTLEPYSDVKCRCGGYGCFEALVSPHVVIAAARKQYTDFPTSLLYAKMRDNQLELDDVFAAANEGDAFGRILLDRVIHYFSILIHNIILLRDPTRIVIQGGYARAGEYFLSSLREKVAAMPFYKNQCSPIITYSSINDFNPYISGAVQFGVDEYLHKNELYD